jgi:hypothetical protein
VKEGISGSEGDWSTRGSMVRDGFASWPYGGRVPLTRSGDSGKSGVPGDLGKNVGGSIVMCSLESRIKMADPSHATHTGSTIMEYFTSAHAW